MYSHRVGYTMQSKFKDEFYKTREDQIEAIERIFEAAKKPVLKHPSKLGVTAVEELPIFPDFDVREDTLT